MNISYSDKSDLLYLRLDDTKQEVINKKIDENIVLDIGVDDKIVGIEILNASKIVSLSNLLPINFESLKTST